MARAWALLTLLTALNILSWVDRQIIPALAPLLIAELGLTSAQIGLLYGYAFILCFIAAGLVLGTLADRVHRPRLIAAGLAAWSVFTGVSGLARSFAHLAAARVMVGIGEASLTPAALAMLSDAFPPRWRARAAGIFSAGVPLGSGLSLIVAGLLAPRFGWRACFFALGAAGVVAAFGVAFVREPRDEPAEAGPHRNDEAGPYNTPQTGAGFSRLRGFGLDAPLRDLLRSLRRSPALLWTIAGGALVTFSTAATIHVLTWLVQERGFDFRRAALLTGGIYATAGACGNVIGGWFADWCQRRWRGGRLWSLVITQAVLVPAALAFFTSRPGGVPFYAAWVFTSLRGTVWYGPLYASAQDLAPAHVRATAVAFLMLAINLLGAGPGPWLAGAIGDRSSLTNGLVVTTWIGLLSVVPFALAARRAG